MSSSDRPRRPSGSTSAAPRCSVSCSTRDGEVLGEQRRLSPHAGVDALRRDRDRDRRRARARARHRSVSARPGWSATTATFSTRRTCRPCVDAPLREALPTRPRHPIVVDNDANVAALGEIAYGAAVGVAARAARHARHRHRRRRCCSTASCTAARTASAPRSGTSPSSAAARCARAASTGTGRRSRRAPRSGAWRASSSSQGGGARILAAAGGDRDAVAGCTSKQAARAGDADAIALLAPLRRQRRARPRRRSRTCSTRR